MRRAVASLVVLAVALLAAGAIGATTAGARPAPLGFLGPGLLHFTLKRACAKATAGHAACNAIQATPSATGTAVGPAASPLVTAAPPYGPADLQSAYNLPNAVSGGPGTGETVAIVDANDDPNAESDLATYRSRYGLAPCTTANGCFKKVNQSGGTSYPTGDSGWAEEISLDLDMVSAICGNCHILLVEASSASFANLAAAVNEAAVLHATQISNSYGGSEFSGEASSQSAYNHPGIDITVSSGDSGYGVEFPAASQYVTAVGGTRLTPDSSNPRGWTESVWSTSSSEGAGSGCSKYITKPAWQHDPGCAKRTVADVSADADPATGVAVYDTYGVSGWLQFGGTSVASPIIASVDALAGGRASGSFAYGQYAYANPTQFFDVTSGSNGSCSITYLCTGVVGYDGPTGIGTPNGAGPVTPPAPPTNTGLPSISGTPPVVGQPLTALPGTWNGSPAPTYAYQWMSCSATCAPVATGSGASSTYTPANADVGNYITVTVTATNTSGSVAAASGPTSSVTLPPAPSNFGAPTIAGTPPVVGQQLTASPGTWTGSPTYAYQWMSCSTKCAVVATGSGANSTYTPVNTDVGNYITVTVTATNAGGSVAASSGQTAVVTAPVQSFSLTASPTTRTVSAGSSAAYVITVHGTGGFVGSVTFKITGPLPTGVTASFSPSASTTTSTLTLKSTRSSPAGAHAITVTGTSGSLSASTSVNVTYSGTCFFFCS